MKALLLSLGLVSSVLASSQTTERYDPAYYASVLERKTEIQADTIYTLKYKLAQARRIMLKEHVHKKAWIKVVVAQTVLFGGITLALLSGAWVPVAMGVVAIEAALLLEGRYRLNTQDLKEKKQPDRWKM